MSTEALSSVIQRSMRGARYVYVLDWLSVVALGILLAVYAARGFQDHIVAALGVAAVLSPTSWAAFQLLSRIFRYEIALRHVAAATTPSESMRLARLAYWRLQAMHALRETLASSWVRGSIYVAYLVRYFLLQFSIAKSDLNPSTRRSDAVLLETKRRSGLLLAEICRFVLDSRSRERHLEAAINAAQAAGDPRIVSEIVRVTFSDGHGILSTLTALIHLHFLAGLPLNLRATVWRAVARLPFEPSEFGWLSHRVLEGVVKLAVQLNYDEGQIAAELRPMLVQAEQILRLSEPDREERKWQARSGILEFLASR